MTDRTFEIQVTMEERWVPQFLGMLKQMENLGKVGSSQMIAFYSDGDGDYRPRFLIREGEDRLEDRLPLADDLPIYNHFEGEFYDAG